MAVLLGVALIVVGLPGPADLLSGVADTVAKVTGSLLGVLALVVSWVTLAEDRGERRSAEAREHAAAHAASKSRPPQTWRLVDVSEPGLLGSVGVHRTEPGPCGDRADWWADLPEYLPRDHDELLQTRLRTASESGGNITVIGDSSTGKTRSVWEAVRAVLPDWQVLLADDAEAVREAAGSIPVRTVVWLDDTPDPRFLLPDHAGGLTANEITAMVGVTGGPVIVLHLLWPGWHRRITAGPSLGHNHQAEGPRDLFSQARAVLALARDAEPVEVGAAFSPAERDRLGSLTAADPRWAGAAADSEYGPIQHLAGVPELMRRYRRAAPGEQAVLRAAVDIRRLGYTGILTRDLLADAADGHLLGKNRATSAEDWFDHALAEVTRLSHGHVAPLLPVPDHRPAATLAGWTLTDYLQQQGVRDRYLEPTPDSIWTALLHHSDREYIRSLSEQARFHKPHLTEHFLRADPYSAQKLAELLRGQGREQELRDLASTGNIFMARELVDLLREQCREQDLRDLVAAGNRDAALGLADLLKQQGREQESERVLRDQAATGDGQAALGLAQLLMWQGREQDLRSLAASGNAYAAGQLIKLLGERGQEQDLRDLIVAGDTDAARELINLLREQGREQDLRDMAATGDPYAGLGLADLLNQQGREREYERVLRDLTATGDTDALWRTYAQRMLARLLRQQGRDHELRDLAAAGDFLVAEELIGLLKEQGRERELRDMVSTGIIGADHGLAELLLEQGREPDLRELAAAGNAYAALGLAELLKVQGRDQERERVLRDLAAAGDTTAALKLVELLTEQGRERDLLDLAATGGVRAVWTVYSD